MSTTDRVLSEQPQPGDDVSGAQQTGGHGTASGGITGARAVAHLPPDHSRQWRGRSTTASHPFRLQNRLSARLEELAAREEVTLTTVLAASLAVLLARYTDEERFEVGWNGTDTLADLSRRPNMVELLGSVKAERAEPTSDTSSVQGATGCLTDDRGNSPQVVIGFAPGAAAWARAQRSWEVFGRPIGVELCFEFEHPESRPEGGTVGPRLSGRLFYDDERFDAGAIERLTEHWQVLLDAMVEDPWCPVGDLPILTASRARQLLGEWGNAPEPPSGPDIVDLVAEQAANRSDAVAAQCGPEKLTYSELADRANRLARLLQDRGVGPDVIVGVCLERSVDHVVALLAILKAGGAFLLLDPEAPGERTRYILQDSRSPLVLTHQSLHSKVAETETAVLCMDHVEENMGQRSAQLFDHPPRPGQPAYVSYTSGSTGRPKGVVVERGPLSAHCRVMAAMYELGPDDRVLQFSQFSADASLEQIFSTLTVGARLVMRGTDIWTPEQLREELVLRRVTVMNLWPTYFQQVVRAWSRTPNALTSLRLRLVILGGERLGAHLLAQWRQLGVDTRVLNAYGPTEGIITATLSEAGEERDVVTIGRPLPGRKVYLLDPSGQPVPLGGAGELYLGGSLLARGYLNRPELTEERFVADRYDAEGRGRLYRTGDRARFLADGRIVYLGRVDDQVKVRGYRIELGEVEAILTEHSSVDEAVVVAREDGEDTELVAYVVASGDGPLVEEELRRHLEAKLPRPMQPTVITELATMPRLATGKPDRRRLPVIERTHRRDPSSYVPPTLLVHEHLIRIWEELLEARPIGIRDNFFHLGGHSLLAAQLVQRIEQTLGKKTALSTLFANPTIEQLATSLEEEAARGAKTRVLPVQAHGDRRPLFFLHGDWTRGGFYCLDLARACGDEQPFFVLEPYRFDSDDPAPTVEVIARAHIDALRQVQERGPFRLGGFCNGGVLAFEMARQLQEEGEQVEFLGLVNPSAPRQRSLLRWVTSKVTGQRSRAGGRDAYLRTRHAFRHVYRTVRPKAQRVADFGALLSIEPRLADMFPPPDALVADYVGVISWALASYRPGAYYGKATFFWAAEEPRIARSWRPILRHMSPSMVEQHTVPGDHMSTVTLGIAELAHAFAGSVDRLEPGSVDASIGQAESREDGEQATFVTRDLRTRDVPGVIRIQRRSFPKDRWTSAISAGQLVRSAVRSHPAVARRVERLLSSVRVTEALSALRLARLVAFRSPPRLHYIVATSGREVVGFACLNAVMCDDMTGGGRAKVETVAVEPDRRGQGIGTTLLMETIAVARRAGYGELSLNVRPGNDEARRLYERMGFEEADVISHHYQPSGTDALVMVRDLRGAPEITQWVRAS